MNLPKVSLPYPMHPDVDLKRVREPLRTALIQAPLPPIPGNCYVSLVCMRAKTSLKVSHLVCSSINKKIAIGIKLNAGRGHHADALNIGAWPVLRDVSRAV